MLYISRFDFTSGLTCVVVAHRAIALEYLDPVILFTTVYFQKLTCTVFFVFFVLCVCVCVCFVCVCACRFCQKTDAAVARNSLQAITVMVNHHVTEKMNGKEGLSSHLSVKPDAFVHVLRTLLHVRQFVFVCVCVDVSMCRCACALIYWSTWYKEKSIVFVSSAMLRIEGCGGEARESYDIVRRISRGCPVDSRTRKT